MNHIRKIANKQLLVILILTLFISAFSLLIIPLNNSLTDINEDLLFKLRGTRQLSDDIVFVFISQEDIDILGGWPLSRDYYAFLLHLLMEQQAAVIGIDILFENPSKLYAEFDENLIKYTRTARNVCMPMLFSRITERNGEIHGKNPLLPMKSLREALAGIGFSNIGSAAIIREVPVSIMHGDTVYHSFGAELADLYSRKSRKTDPSPAEPHLRLNHFGDVRNLESYSLTEFFREFTRDTFALNLTGKIVLVGVIAPGKATTTATPLSKALPASLIHATATENLIDKNYLREFPLPAYWFWLLFTAFLAWLVWQIKTTRTLIVVNTAAVFTIIIMNLVIFSYYFTAPPVIIQLFIYLVSVGYIYVSQRKYETVLSTQQQNLLRERISAKEKELVNARQTLKEYQHQLNNTEKQSEELLELAEERKKSILQLESELRDLQSYTGTAGEMPVPDEFEDIIHASDSSLGEVLKLVQRISHDDITVLIIGETGSGKEMIARAIHNTSERSNKSFIAVNCGALTETLLESELFGHERGSFTGATSRRRGRFELASGGTIFLDEISETSPAFQAKLLRILQEGIFERVGGEQSLKVDIRVIAASNQNLQALMDENKFRSDLYYRLNGFQIRIPPLRERKQDIPLLAHHFLKKFKYQEVTTFSSQVIELFTRYSWPGNVRELENVIHRAAIMASSDYRNIVRLSDLPEEFQKSVQTDQTTQSYQALEDQILETLRSYKFSHAAISQTAKALGNRDRGTITEYLRGICFQEIVNRQYNIEAAARVVAASGDEAVLEQVRKKMQEYLANLQPLPAKLSDESALPQLPQFKGLPKKYHRYLIQVIKYLKVNSLS